MKHITVNRSKSFNKTFHTPPKLRLSEKSKKMLDLIYNFPGMNTNTIQAQLKFESRHTLLKYMKELLDYELVEFKKNSTDRRQKLFKLTDKGHQVLEWIFNERMDNCLQGFLNTFSRIFLIMNPEYIDSMEWNKFKEIGFSESFSKKIKHQVFAYILKVLNSN
ncbi:MAG: winged helix DNA-binding protein [Candidatus Hodarchaeales archaeon]|jgi:DNA-binding MarR family transcriptional regulator